MDEAISLFKNSFPPAENLQVANDFKSYAEISTIISQWLGKPPNQSELIQALVINNYVTEVIGNTVVFLIA